MSLFSKKPCNIESVTVLTMRLSGMRFVTEYEITTKEDKAVVAEYDILFGGSDKKRELKKSAELDTKEVVEALNSFKVMSWNGFYGPHPKGVMDGTMFSLEGVVNGDVKFYAHGSQNFPKHFREFRDWLYNSLYKKD